MSIQVKFILIQINPIKFYLIFDISEGTLKHHHQHNHTRTHELPDSILIHSIRSLSYSQRIDISGTVPNVNKRERNVNLAHHLS
jgi:hypothetical protein